MAAPPPSLATLAAVFGNSNLQIGELVKGFDFTKCKINTSVSTRNDYLHLDLAPSYGNLTNGAIRDMDDHLKIMITATMKSLEKMAPEDRTWSNVMATMMQNPLLEPEGGDVNRADKLIKKGINIFKLDSTPETPIVKEVQSWFVRLINDMDVLESTKIDIMVLANIVAQTGAIIDSLPAFLVRAARQEKTLVDIGVLRFPDVDRPYFKVYRIKLQAWSQSARLGIIQGNENGITGEYFARNFKPRRDFINKLEPDIQKKAMQYAVDLLS